jgi:hypothetical protein
VKNFFLDIFSFFGLILACLHMKQLDSANFAANHWNLMNSSLKQPYPVSLSLNDCLIKGPSALVDLFTVTLCIQEHRYALTKDLSKFYQRVDADPVAQNLRRVMWRGGDTSAEMKVYITTTVNLATNQQDALQ